MLPAEDVVLANWVVYMVTERAVKPDTAKKYTSGESTPRVAQLRVGPSAAEVNVQDSMCCFLGDTCIPDTLLRAFEEASQRSASSLQDHNNRNQGSPRSGSLPGSASAGLMIGPAQSGLPFHQHDLAVNALIHGEKRWFLLPEAQDSIGQDLVEQHLYGLGANVDGLGWALQNFEVVDMRIEQWRWTGNAEIGKHILQCAQHESDVFIVPRGWHHAVINVADSICLNYQPGNI
ncbi:hypothetical protein CYMTET_37529 [Cymbomonas tetramitiformis]|uniref:JmjC domain-containing protein n=1 Tax=Cymbomonas tetramitiformis TaxID=36881 RepID=A0AAE0F652_9CHLO|nr:hypothetical protein CYMTET_37529 [Cymbomonas tetramitiformis]